jgi:hypothetical protein
MLSLAVFYYGKAKPGIPLRSRQWDFSCKAILKKTTCYAGGQQSL